MQSDAVEKIKERLGIKEVVENYLKLEKAGKNLKAKCPFHNEKTPSFYVSPDRGSYYCFGCGAKGDIFSFTQNIEGLDFPGALKMLAEKVGVELPKYSGKSEDKKESEKLYKILDDTTKFFEDNLSNKKNEQAKKYLLDRGLTEKSIENWKIGYAENDWRLLKEYLMSLGYLEQDLEKVGVVKENEKGGDSYDRFRSRVMFPIFDSNSKPVGFTGRIFPDDKNSAKYMNSPETPLFNKSKILYGYNKAKSSIVRYGFSILVEGQMDVIMSHQAGYTNTVASSGTALTEDQLNLLKRLSSKLLIAYDSDEAGFKASERAWLMALELGMEVKVAKMEGGKDPADLVKESPDLLKKSIRESKHIVDFLIDKLESKKIDNIKKLQNVTSEVLPYVKKVKTKTMQSYFVQRISDVFNVNQDYIWKDLESIKNDSKEIEKQIPVEKKTTKNDNDPFRLAFALMFADEKDFSFRKKMEEILKESFGSYENTFGVDKENLIFFIETSIPNFSEENIKKDILSRLEIYVSERELDNLIKTLKLTTEENIEKEILKKIQEVRNKIDGLKSG